MRLRAPVVALLLFVAAMPAAPTRAETPILASNVDLIGVIPEQGAVGGRLVHQDGKPYFIFTGAGGFSVYDVTNPELPLLAGHLELPHYENEDVDYCGGLVTIARDPAFDGIGGLVVLDMRNLPLIVPATLNPAGYTSAMGASFFQFEAGYAGGHTAAFVTGDCRWVYATGIGGGEGLAYIIDLADPANPLEVGILSEDDPDSVLAGGTHDFYRDDTGLVWSVGSGGSRALSVADPLHPQLVSNGSQTTDISGSRFNHNILRDGDTLFITNENYVTPGCVDQGRFGTYAYGGGDSFTKLDTWTPPMGEDGNLGLGGQTDGNQAAPVGVCSAHWFDERDGLVAIGWYQQGTRILDVSDPSDIREVGYFLAPDAFAWGAYFITDDIVYSLDQTHGINILRIDRTAAAASPATLKHTPKAPGAQIDLPFAPGYSCVIRKPVAL